MRRRRTSLFSVALVVGAIALIAATPISASSEGRGHARVLLTGLDSPKALALLDNKTLVVGQGAYSPPPGAPAFSYAFKGANRGTQTNLTDPVNIVDAVITPDGAGWAIGGDGVVYRQVPGGPITAVLDMHAYQAADPDPYNKPGEDPAETNPFGLAALKNSDVLLADAAANDVIHIKADGTAWTVARWVREMIKTDRLGDPSLPPKLPAEAVPTSITIGPDGWAYVGQLMGFPGRPGSAHIWRVNPNGNGAVCDANHRTRDCRVWKSHFTSIMDVAFQPGTWTLYVYEAAKAGWLKLEEGFTTGKFPAAVLYVVRPGRAPRELVPGKLSQPGGLVVTRGGEVFVTDGMFTGGRLVRIVR
jgi:hypothetical protein